MRKCLLVGLFCVTALADIKEASTMKDALKDAQKGTLVIFDIDNTLLEPVQTIGSDQWVESLIHEKTEALKAQGKPESEAKVQALKQALFDWKKVQRLTQMRPVEAATPELVRALQDPKRDIKVVALTARPVDLAESTRVQLLDNDIDLAANSVAKHVIELERSDDDVNFEARFFKGIVFAGNHPKGEILVKLMKQVGLKPKKIIFVDDKLKNCQSIEASLDRLHVPHTSYRYGAADNTVKAFDRAIADEQWKQLRLLSDADAKRATAR